MITAGVKTWSTACWEDGDLRVRAYVDNIDAVPITQASLNGIACTVYDVENNHAVTGTPTVTVASAVFDTLQSWAEDSVGYNFKFTLPGSCFPQDREYLVEFLFDPASGSDFPLPIRAFAKSVRGS